MPLALENWLCSGSMFHALRTFSFPTTPYSISASYPRSASDIFFPPALVIWNQMHSSNCLKKSSILGSHDNRGWNVELKLNLGLFLQNGYTIIVWGLGWQFGHSKLYEFSGFYMVVSKWCGLTWIKTSTIQVPPPSPPLRYYIKEIGVNVLPVYQGFHRFLGISCEHSAQRGSIFDVNS